MTCRTLAYLGHTQHHRFYAMRSGFSFAPRKLCMKMAQRLPNQKSTTGHEQLTDGSAQDSTREILEEKPLGARIAEYVCQARVTRYSYVTTFHSVFQHIFVSGRNPNAKRKVRSRPPLCSVVSDPVSLLRRWHTANRMRVRLQPWSRTLHR